MLNPPPPSLPPPPPSPAPSPPPPPLPPIETTFGTCARAQWHTVTYLGVSTRTSTRGQGSDRRHAQPVFINTYTPHAVTEIRLAQQGGLVRACTLTPGRLCPEVPDQATSEST